MSIYQILLLPLVAIILIASPLFLAYRRYKNGKEVKIKSTLTVNLISLFGTLVLFTILPLGGFVSADAAAEVANASAEGMRYLAAALSTGAATIATGIAVASAASAAIGAVSEDEKNFTKALIFVALGEGVAIYGMLISILILYA